MTHSISEHSTHVSRLHHHRERVHAARAAVEEAISSKVAAHYAEREAAATNLDPETPVNGSDGEGSPTSQPTTSGPVGAHEGAGND